METKEEFARVDGTVSATDEATASANEAESPLITYMHADTREARRGVPTHLCREDSESHRGVVGDQEIAGLKLRVRALEKALGTLIAWLPQSANSPIRQDEASRLLNILNGHEE